MGTPQDGGNCTGWYLPIPKQLERQK